jgi:hypothetical protein
MPFMRQRQLRSRRADGGGRGIVIKTLRRLTLMPFDGRLCSLQRHAIRDRRQAQQAEGQGVPDRLFHINIAETHTEQGTLYLVVAIDRTSTFASAQSV